MQIKTSRLLLLLLTGLGIVTFTYMIYVQVWEQHVRRLNGTIERGIMMQMTISQFENSVGRFPSYGEFTNVYSHISSFQQGVTMTNRVASVFDNLGGWYYCEKLGEISIDSDKKYSIGLMSWADLSGISFYSPTKIKVSRYGKLGTWDYSYLNQHLSVYAPDIAATVKMWVTTNKSEQVNSIRQP
jgi:hypothetical protein